MKKVQKSELMLLRSYLAGLNVVGLTPEKAKAVLRLHRRVKQVAEELSAEQKELIEQYAIKMKEDGAQIDIEGSEHFAEYASAYASIVSEKVDLSEFCIMTEDEALKATAKLDAPISVVDVVVELLTLPEQPDNPEKKEE